MTQRLKTSLLGIAEERWKETFGVWPFNISQSSMWGCSGESRLCCAPKLAPPTALRAETP